MEEASRAVGPVVSLTKPREVDLLAGIDDARKVRFDTLVAAGAERVRLIHTEGFCGLWRTLQPRPYLVAD
jgi:hypothetical protein